MLQGSLKVPVAHTMNYLHPAWHEYNIGLTKLTDSSRSKGPLVAPNAGHYIQKDNPDFVAGLILDMLKDIKNVT
jgi:hypothetical protein